jgi:CheY-like chemotaxis protein
VTYTVLLVEDSPTDVFVIKEVLGGCAVNFRVDVAQDGQEALRYLQDPTSGSCPALVLLDLNIPRVDGLEVLRQLRAGSRCWRTPVIVVSSSRADQDRSMAEQLGANAYFQKPSDLESYRELGRVVEHVLGRAGVDG